MSKLINRSILIVDDEADIRDILREELELKGAKVFEASNGQDALDILNQKNIEVVLSDFKMPNKNGLELLRTLREKDPINPKFYMITAYAESQQDLLAIGAQGVFLKPFRIEQILHHLEEDLG